MSYEEIKNRKHFQQLVNKFLSERKNIKSAIITNKIGEEAIATDILKSTAPVVEAIKQQAVPQPAIQQSLVQPIKLLAIDEPVDYNQTESQKILRAVLAVGDIAPTSFEVNPSTGKIGTDGVIDTNKLLNEDKIIFSSDNGRFKKEIQQTTGLLFLLLAPYKYIKANNVIASILTKDDELMYAKIMHKAGMDANAMRSSMKYKTMIKGVDASPALEMSGSGFRGKRIHKPNSEGKFGALNIDMSLLLSSNQLKASKNGSIVINRKVADDLVDILTKRYNSKKSYSDNTLKIYKKLLELSELSLPSHSKKLKAIKGGCKKIYYEDTKELAERFNILLGELEAGNNNDDIMNESMEIIDILLKHKDIDKSKHEQLYNVLLSFK